MRRRCVDGNRCHCHFETVIERGVSDFGNVFLGLNASDSARMIQLAEIMGTFHATKRPC